MPSVVSILEGWCSSQAFRALPLPLQCQCPSPWKQINWLRSPKTISLTSQGCQKQGQVAEIKGPAERGVPSLTCWLGRGLRLTLNYFLNLRKWNYLHTLQPEQPELIPVKSEAELEFCFRVDFVGKAARRTKQQHREMLWFGP